MWIESEEEPPKETPGAPNSFASNGECGLKDALAPSGGIPTMKFIRQQWRMWIETKQVREA